MLMLSVIGGILFFLLYCCLVVGKRSDKKNVLKLQHLTIRWLKSIAFLGS